MHLRLRWCCGCACLWAGATLPNKSSSVHLGSPADIFFALLRASRLALGAAFLCVGSGFGVGAGIRFRPPKQPSPPPFRPASQQRCSAVVAVRPFDERDLTDQHRLYPPTLLHLFGSQRLVPARGLFSGRFTKGQSPMISFLVCFGAVYRDRARSAAPDHKLGPPGSGIFNSPSWALLRMAPRKRAFSTWSSSFAHRHFQAQQKPSLKWHEHSGSLNC